jgi:hypothetical protein
VFGAFRQAQEKFGDALIAEYSRRKIKIKKRYKKTAFP